MISDRTPIQPRLILINRYFSPDESATSELATQLAIDLVRRGWRVRAVASRQRYEDARERLARREIVAGVDVCRLWTTRFGRSNIFGRSLDYVTFYLSAFLYLLQSLRSGDIVIAKTDPPLISVVAVVAGTIRGAKVVNWLQDVFPEVAERLGMRWASGLTGRIARLLRDFSLSHAISNVAIGKRMESIVRAHVHSNAVDVRVIPNWADTSFIVPVSNRLNPLRTSWQLGDSFVVGYSGNMGRAHEFSTILGAIERLRDEAELRFLFVGGGYHLREIKREVNRRELHERVKFQAFQPRKALPVSLAVCDIHLVSLRPALEGYIVPSKFYGIAAAGRATIFIGDVTGEIAEALDRFECGYAVATGDSEGLAQRIAQLMRDRKHCEALGENAREAAVRFFDRRMAVERWDALLREVAKAFHRPVQEPS